jgi:hypothetical protein
MDIGDGGETKGWMRIEVFGLPEKVHLSSQETSTACIRLLLVKGNCVILRKKRGAAISSIDPVSFQTLFVFRFCFLE